jgi:exodeoxyribonuclease-5
MWNDQQAKGLKEVDKWFIEYKTSRGRNKKQVYRLFGHAGTGKTTLARHFAEGMGQPIFAAFTGKASLVMRKAGCLGARTIHSLIYIAEEDKKTGEVSFRLNRNSDLNDADLLIIDECSMVNAEMGNHLLSFGKPILVLGDPAQLPPVEGAGFFTEQTPDTMLTEIHRQAKDNPIIFLATQVRNGIIPDIGSYGDSRVISKISSTDALAADQILVGRNVTRESMNSRMRKWLNFTSELPSPNEKLICLRNDSTLGIYNGGMFTVDLAPPRDGKKPDNKINKYYLKSDDEDRPIIEVEVHDSFFDGAIAVPDWKKLKKSQQFAYSYGITVHKAQGSQWGNVLLYGSESYVFRDQQFRFLYTGVTRASETLTMVV